MGEWDRQPKREVIIAARIKARGLAIAPGVAVGDGALGFWKAVDEVFPGTGHQRCWVHKISNVLNKFPKSMAPAVTSVACLTKDAEALLAFFDLPAEHWDHLRTSNPVESVFATVRHRTLRTRGALSQKTVKLMVFTLIRAASQKWRRLNGANQVPRVTQGVNFTDGVANSNPAKTSAA